MARVREVFDPDPRQGPCIVDHERQVAAAGLGIPPDKLVPRRDLPGRGAEAEDGEGFASGGPNEVLRAGQRRIAEVASDELVPEAAFARVPDGLNGDGLDIGETLGGRERGPVGRGTGHERTADDRRAPWRRQDDHAVHAQHGDARAPLGRRRACASRGGGRPPATAPGGGGRPSGRGSTSSSEKSRPQ